MHDLIAELMRQSLALKMYHTNIYAYKLVYRDVSNSLLKKKRMCFRNYCFNAHRPRLGFLTSIQSLLVTTAVLSVFDMFLKQIAQSNGKLWVLPLLHTGWLTLWIDIFLENSSVRGVGTFTWGVDRILLVLQTTDDVS